MRISQSLEMRAGSYNGRSLDGGKQDDLALFNEVQNKQRESLLLQSTDDLNIFSTKLKHIPDDYKLGVSSAAPGQSSDLLNVVDKNDYDWLITPPESPLFSCLDDEASALDHVLRGKPRSQCVPVSQPSTVVKSYRNSRVSANPRCLSPSPRSGRPFSASRSAPPPTFPHSSSSRRRSPSPCKSIPAAVSGKPTPRRLNTRGRSPVKATSVSPKIKAWQLNIPGISCDAPPNLRTTAGSSYVRGTSPVSRNGSGSSRQSVSPTASRSVSSYSRGSVISSGDDYVDSLPSKTFSCSDHSVQRVRNYSKSATRRPSGVVLRQVEKKNPHNMFRPLLSSVPSSTLYSGKGSSQSRSLNSRNSSFTRSSNDISGQGTSGSVGQEDVEQKQVDNDFLSTDQTNASYEDADISITKNPGIADPSSHLGSVPDEASGTDLCSKCYVKFHSVELVMEGDRWFCRKCNTSEADQDHVDNGIVSHVLEHYVPCKKDLVMSSIEELELSADGEPGHKQKQRFDSCEGNGVSLLLKRSSVQAHMFPSRSYSASNTSFDDFSYLRDSLTSLQSSVGQSSMSMSSSLDFGSSRCTETGKSMSGSSTHVFRFPSMTSCSSEDGVEITSLIGTLRQSLTCECTEAETTGTDVGINGKTIDTEDHSVSVEKGNKWTSNSRNSNNEETSTSNSQFYGQEDTPRLGTLDTISELELKSSDLLSAESIPDSDSKNPKTESVTANAEAPSVVLEDEHAPRGSRIREEAMDVILLCSSIVHDIANNAAYTAINREISSAVVEIPAPPFPNKLISVIKDIFSRTSFRRRSIIPKTGSRKQDMEDKSTPRIILSPAISGSNTAPPNLDSKCNCTIM